VKEIVNTCLALACVITPVAQAATYYVNNLSNCTSSCGAGYNTGIKNLSDAIKLAKPGDTVAIYGANPITRAVNPPYYVTNGGVPASVVGNAIMDFNALVSTNVNQATTTVRAVALLPKPVIRGTFVVKDGWTLVSNDGSGYLYKRAWAVTHVGQTQTQEPQQVFRDSLGFNALLQQVGGRVFGGYYPGMDLTKMWGGDPAQLAMAISTGGALWSTDVNKPGYRFLVGSTAQGAPILSSNQFYFDSVNKTLYVKLATALSPGEALEVSAMPAIASNYYADAQPTRLLRNLTLSNLVFERSNTSFEVRAGMVNLAGSGITIDSVDFRQADAQCLALQVGGQNKVVNSTFSYCGQVGLVANGGGHLIQGNYFVGNNLRGFNQEWEAGATKFIGGMKGEEGLYDSKIQGNVAVANNGSGIWVDGDTIQRTLNGHGNTIDGNVLAFNWKGVYLENSGGAKITSNVVYGNKFQAIHFRGSPKTTIDGNVLVGNGFSGVDIESNSSSPGFTQVDMTISNNAMAWNREMNSPPDYIPVAANGATSLYGNTYCGTASPKFTTSMAFVLRDSGSLGVPDADHSWAAWNGMGLDVANTSKGWKASTMKLVSPPSTVLAWQTQPDIASAGTISTIATTRANIRALVTNNCK
jgi:parallel beta-helix repeat protein